MNCWSLATEDELSEAVGVRLLASLPEPIVPRNRFRRNGFGYLKSSADKWRELARRQRVFLLTDLDMRLCPAALRKEWLGEKLSPGLIFRVAVRETEAWLLADHEGVAALLGPKGKLPVNPDGLADPKQHLLRLASKAPRTVRDDLVRQEGSRLRQAVAYNSCLSAWVASTWSPERAAQRSESLRRTLNRLCALASTDSPGGKGMEGAP